MSIIHEALKKAGQEKESVFTAKDAEGIRKNLQLELEKKKGGVNWGPVFVIIVLLMITTPIVAPMFSAPFKRGPLPAAILTLPLPSQNVPALPLALPVMENPMVRSGQFGIEEVSRPPQALPPDLSLSGIMYSPADASYGIINNKVVKIGDTVAGARVVKVNPDRVLLDFEGQEITLYSETTY